MTFADSYPFYFFRSRFEKKPVKEEHTGILRKDKPKRSGPDEQNDILCRQCFQMITTMADSIEVQGSHQHSFVNPHGLIFELECFRSASGCIYSGIPTFEWSWFNGYKWQVALCGKCLAQAGWLFTSSDKGNFNALIRNRLIFP